MTGGRRSLVCSIRVGAVARHDGGIAAIACLLDPHGGHRPPRRGGGGGRLSARSAWGPSSSMTRGGGGGRLSARSAWGPSPAMKGGGVDWRGRGPRSSSPIILAGRDTTLGEPGRRVRGFRRCIFQHEGTAKDHEGPRRRPVPRGCRPDRMPSCPSCPSLFLRVEKIPTRDRAWPDMAHAGDETRASMVARPDGGYPTPGPCMPSLRLPSQSWWRWPLGRGT